MAATAFFLLLAPAQGFWPILTLSAGALVFWNALTPLADAVIVEGVRLILKKENPMVLAEELNSYLLPGERVNWRSSIGSRKAA